MKGRVWITRTEPGASKTARAVATLGYEPLIAPVLSVRRLKPIFDPHSFDALVVTSRNGLDAFCALCSRRALSVWCVGDATAEAAQHYGFQRAISAGAGGGDVRALATLILGRADKSVRLFHPAAKDPAWPLAATLRGHGFTVAEAAVYETVPVLPGLPEPQTLTHGLIHSPRAAEPAVAALTRALTTAPSRAASAGFAFIAISPAAASALDTALAGSDLLKNLAGRTRISAFPDEASMLKQLQ